MPVARRVASAVLIALALPIFLGVAMADQPGVASSPTPTPAPSSSGADPPPPSPTPEPGETSQGEPDPEPEPSGSQTNPPEAPGTPDPSSSVVSPTAVPSDSPSPIPEESTVGETADLQAASAGLFLTTSDDDVMVGDDLTLTGKVVNDDDGPVAGAQLEVMLPKGLAFSSSTPIATSLATGPTGTLLGFALSDLGSHSVTEVKIEVVAEEASGPEGVVAQAVLFVPEMSDRFAEATIVIAPESPVLLRMMPVPLLTEVGGRITYRMTAENVSQQSVDDVSVVNLVPSEVHVLYVDLTEGVDAAQFGRSGGKEDVVWEMGDMDAGEKVSLVWHGRVARPGDLKTVNRADARVADVSSSKARTEGFLAATGPTAAQNPYFAPREKTVVVMRAPIAVEAAADGSVLAVTGLSPWSYILAAGILIAAGFAFYLAGSIEWDRKKLCSLAVGAALLTTACVATDGDPSAKRGPTAPTESPADKKGAKGKKKVRTRVKGTRIERTGGDGQDEEGTIVDLSPGTGAEPAVPADPVAVVESVTVGLEDLAIEPLASRPGDNSISYQWDEGSRSLPAASSSITRATDTGVEMLTSLSAEDGAIRVRVAIRNLTSRRRIAVKGHIVHEVRGPGGSVASLRSPALEETLAPGGEAVARFSYLLPSGQYGASARFVSTQ